MIDPVEMIRFFTEFTLSEDLQSLLSFRMTASEGFRMTNILIPLLRHSLSTEKDRGGGDSSSIRGLSLQFYRHLLLQDHLTLLVLDDDILPPFWVLDRKRLRIVKMGKEEMGASRLLSHEASP